MEIIGYAVLYGRGDQKSFFVDEWLEAEFEARAFAERNDGLVVDIVSVEMISLKDIFGD